MEFVGNLGATEKRLNPKPYLITLILALIKERYPNHNANFVLVILIFALKITRVSFI
jgi:hypothetical protein